LICAEQNNRVKKERQTFQPTKKKSEKKVDKKSIFCSDSTRPHQEGNEVSAQRRSQNAARTERVDVGCDQDQHGAAAVQRFGFDRVVDLLKAFLRQDHVTHDKGVSPIKSNQS
jgi:hypothetical protein